MANPILTKRTTLSGEDVIVRAVQFFATANWKPTTQSARAATFEGKPAFPWFLLLCTVLAFACFVVPGILLWFLVVRKARRFQNLVITTTSAGSGTEVTVTYPSNSKKLVQKFLNALPN